MILTPKLFGAGGFWSAWDWNAAFELNVEASGIPYSGSYGWCDTAMYWPLSHMVQSADNALGCGDCHTSDGPIDFESLGYDGDPMSTGGRF